LAKNAASLTLGQLEDLPTHFVQASFQKGNVFVTFAADLMVSLPFSKLFIVPYVELGLNTDYNTQFFLRAHFRCAKKKLGSQTV
jgi:hypothetical protein